MIFKKKEEEVIPIDYKYSEDRIFHELKEYVDKRIPYLVKELKKNKDNIKNKVVQIKLKEAINSINKFCGSGKNKNIKDSSVVQMMRYYELLKELKSAGKK